MPSARVEDELRQMILREWLADAAGDQIQQEVGGRLLRQRCGGRARLDERCADPRVDQIRQVRPINMATRVLIR